MVAMKDYRAEIERVLKDEFDPNFVPHARCLLRELLGWFEAMDALWFITHPKAGGEISARELERLETLKEILHGGVKWDAIKHMPTEEETMKRYAAPPPAQENEPPKCPIHKEGLIWIATGVYVCSTCKKELAYPDTGLIHDGSVTIEINPDTNVHERKRLEEIKASWDEKAPTDSLTQNSWKCPTCGKQLTWQPDETYICDCGKYTKIPIEDEEDPITPDPVTDQYEARQDRIDEAGDGSSLKRPDFEK